MQSNTDMALRMQSRSKGSTFAQLYDEAKQFHRNFDLAVSQKQHPEIFEQVSSEAEGMKLVKSTIAYLFAIRKPWLIFHFGMQCVGKYAGFWMGRHYEKLSRKQIFKVYDESGILGYERGCS